MCFVNRIGLHEVVSYFFELVLTLYQQPRKTITVILRTGMQWSSNHSTVGNYQPLTLPRMRFARAHVISVTGSNLPPGRHLPSICVSCCGAIVDFAKVQRHVQVGAVALRGEVDGGGGGGGE